MLLLESTKYYRALDNFTHFIMGSSKFRDQWGETATKNERDTHGIPLTEYPQVLIVPEALQGRNIGPPSKSLLAEVIQKVVAEEPRIIVLAANVAPFAADVDSSFPGDMLHQLELNRSLDAAARQSIKLVVLAPMVGSDPMGQIRYDWLRDPAPPAAILACPFHDQPICRSTTTHAAPRPSAWLRASLLRKMSTATVLMCVPLRRPQDAMRTISFTESGSARVLMSSPLPSLSTRRFLLATTIFGRSQR